MEVWQLLLLGVAGALAGWINVLAGGGSLLTVPIMLFMGIPGSVANGTNRVGILIQNIAACSTFFHRGYPDWRLGLSLAIATLPGALVGALLGTQLSGVWFERILAAVMVAVLILMMKAPEPHTEQAESQPLSRQRLILGHIAMLGVGFWGGIIQVGVGFILMPVLHRIMGFDLVRVNQHKVFIVLIYSALALWIFVSSGQVLWLVGLSLAAGNFLGGWLGAHMTLTRGETLIRRVFFIILILFIGKLLFW